MKHEPTTQKGSYDTANTPDDSKGGNPGCKVCSINNVAKDDQVEGVHT